MSKLRSGDNPCPHMEFMKSDGKGKVQVAKGEFAIGIAPLDLRNPANIMKLPKVDKYSYKEINGKVYRISEKGLEYPPITKAQFEEIKRAQEEYSRKDKENEMEY